MPGVFLVSAHQHTMVVVRRPAVTGGGGASKMAMAAAIGSISEQKIQDFQPSLS